MYSDGEYFSTGLFHLNDKESFVDCGAYTGDTVQRFLDTVEKHFKNIYAFEMDKDNYDILCKNIEEYDNENISIYNCGVWNENIKLNYGREDKDIGESYSILKKTIV